MFTGLPGTSAFAAANAFENLRRAGQIRAWGVSNFSVSEHGIPVMAYSPLGGLGANPLGDPTLARIGAARGCSAAAVALAWTIRSGNLIAIPESISVAHVKENAVASSLKLTPQELQALDTAHPSPSH